MGFGAADFGAVTFVAAALAATGFFFLLGFASDVGFTALDGAFAFGGFSTSGSLQLGHLTFFPINFGFSTFNFFLQ